ncbi:hypothetical protein OH77DRAFT_1498807 [Trametes cingulata]|nr:hypothetical protein OH77DRAFT_1498807 [Trametes cingulata]
MQPSWAYTALHNYDILVCLFDTLESRSKGLGRRTLASCALVCRAWSDPASRVLWRRLDSLHPLWALLSGRDFPPSAKRLAEFWEVVDVEEFVKDIALKESNRWKHFLHRASHVRQIATASCREPELALIRAVVKYNGGATFLPTLQKLVWRHGVPSDASLLLVASASLRDLELATTRFAAPLGVGQVFAPLPDGALPQLESLIAGLCDAAPSLDRLVISGRQVPGPVVIPHLLRLTRLRELCLYNDMCVLSPYDMKSILEGMPELKVLYAQLRGFSNPGMTAGSTSLRELRLHATSVDLTALLESYLDAPYLTSLSLGVTDEAYSVHHQRCLRALSAANFARSLRNLSLATLSQPDEPAPAVGPYSNLVEPLAALQDLQVVELRVLNTIMHVRDEDILAVARTWKNLRRLALAYIPSEVLPPLTALRHFATHCPELRDLSLTKMSIPAVIEFSDIPKDAAPHPLRFLDLKLTFASRAQLDEDAIARFLDHLFPNLELSEEGVLDAQFAVFTGPLRRIEDKIRAFRVQRRMQVQG